MTKETWKKQVADILFLLVGIDILLVFFTIGAITSGTYEGGIWFWDVQAKFILKVILNFF